MSIGCLESLGFVWDVEFARTVGVLQKFFEMLASVIHLEERAVATHKRVCGSIEDVRDSFTASTDDRGQSIGVETEY